MPPSPKLAAIALGTNLGHLDQNLQTAIQNLFSLGTVTAISTFHQTTPVGFLDQPDFLNAAALLETTLPPLLLLEALLEIERQMGRIRAGVIDKGPRLIDLDLLLYADEIVTTPTLTIPHPSLHERMFVLTPLAEIASNWPHPILHKTIAQLLVSETGSGISPGIEPL